MERRKRSDFRKQKRIAEEEESKRIESLPTDIKSVLADEKKQAELIVQVINKSPAQLTGFDQWWAKIGSYLFAEFDALHEFEEFAVKAIARSSWEAAKDESSK